MVEPRDEAHRSAEQQEDRDLLTLGLFVYFVALIVLVAGLLVLPALY